MPRNADEPVDWPDEDSPSLAEVLRLIDLEVTDEEVVPRDLAQFCAQRKRKD